MVSSKKFASHRLLFFLLGESSQDRLEKEQSQHEKHDGQFQQNDKPQSASQSHGAKSFVVEAPNTQQCICFCAHNEIMESFNKKCLQQMYVFCGLPTNENDLFMSIRKASATIGGCLRGWTAARNPRARACRDRTKTARQRRHWDEAIVRA